MSPKTQRTKCEALTAAGLPCTRDINLDGNKFCWQHVTTGTRTPSRRAPPRRRSSPVRQRRTSLDSLNAEFERMNVQDINTATNASDQQPLIPSIEKVEFQIIVTPSKENARQNLNSDGVVIRGEVEYKTKHARAKSCEAEIESTEPIAQRNELARPSTSAAAALGPPSPTPRGRRKSQGRSPDSETSQLEDCIPPGLSSITRGKLVEKLEEQFRMDISGLPGHIYVCKLVPFNTTPDPDSETMIIKVGSSENNVHARIGKHTRNCGNCTLLRCFPYSRQFDKSTFDGTRKVYHCKRVEKLVLTQLSMKKRFKDCSCGRAHTEMFSINVRELDEVFECVKWWVSWSEMTFGEWEKR